MGNTIDKLATIFKLLCLELKKLLITGLTKPLSSRSEAIITDLETGDLPLADIFEQFEKAVTELKKCDNFLQEKQATGTNPS